MTTTTEVWVLSVSGEEGRGVTMGLFYSREDAIAAGDAMATQSSASPGDDWGPWGSTDCAGYARRDHLAEGDDIVVQRWAVK